jgi:hypothetical protein
LGGDEGDGRGVGSAGVAFRGDLSGRAPEGGGKCGEEGVHGVDGGCESFHGYGGGCVGVLRGYVGM